MGRKKLNRTLEEIREQNRKRYEKFYRKNRNRIRKEKLKRYHRTMEKELPKM